MPWSVHAIPLPDGDQPCDLWVDADGGLATALEAATTAGYRFLGEPFNQPGRPVTLVTYQDDPRENLAVLSSPRAVLIDGVRVR
ncbi:MAG TPA: hypothetical protein VGH88_05640 [Streptosporangiaceae bacterium]|jgi:hypothetical protein